MRARGLRIAIVMLAVGPASAQTERATATATAAATPEAKAKAKPKTPFQLGAMTGLGHDSNLFDKTTPEIDALSNEATIKGTYDARPAKKLRWKSGAGLTSSFRYQALFGVRWTH